VAGKNVDLEKMRKTLPYEEDLKCLQVEMVRLRRWVQISGRRKRTWRRILISSRAITGGWTSLTSSALTLAVRVWSRQCQRQTDKAVFRSALLCEAFEACYPRASCAEVIEQTPLIVLPMLRRSIA
jgi:hypothetical protein